MGMQREKIVIIEVDTYDVERGLRVGDKGYIIKHDENNSYLCHFPAIDRFQGHGEDGKEWYVWIPG